MIFLGKRKNNYLCLNKQYEQIHCKKLFKIHLNMGTKEGKSFNYYMRALHRDIGFFVIGLTIIFCLSGIVLIYRDTGFLKQEKQIEKQLAANINESELGKALHKRKFEVQKIEGDVIYFQNGTYNKSTGLAIYSENTLPSFLDKLNVLHKAPSNSITHWFSLVYGVSLLFLAISSFWMYQPGSKSFRRGAIIAGLGIVVTVIILIL
jgi:hypothetical protein